jgi:hypothetical protein
METDEVSFFRSRLSKSLGEVTDKLFTSKESSGTKNDLIKIATKKNRDALKITNYLIKERLTSTLDATISKFEKEHPEVKNSFFIAFISDEDFQVEVINKEQAVASVNDVSKEEALSFFTNTKMGYFKRKQFTLITESDSPFQKLKEDLNHFMKSNAKVMHYLKENKEAIYTPNQD